MRARLHDRQAVAGEGVQGNRAAMLPGNTPSGLLLVVRSIMPATLPESVRIDCYRVFVRWNLGSRQKDVDRRSRGPACGEGELPSRTARPDGRRKHRDEG